MTNRRGGRKSVNAGDGGARRFCIGLSLAATLAAGMPAWGQSPQPGGTVADQFQRPELPTSQQIAPFRIERPRPGQAPEAIQFMVRRIVVEGAHSVAADEIAALTQPLEGRAVTFAELAAAADRITALYAASGYALSFALVPEQTVEDGMVRLRVVEGSVDAIEVQFRDPPPLVGRRRIEAVVRRRLRGLIASGPVRTAALERAVLGIDDLAGLDVSVVVRASQTTEAAATLTVIVGTNPIDLSLGADNRLRSEFGREEGYAAIAVNSSLIVGDRLELNARRSFEDDAFNYASIGYETPIGDGPTRLSAGYSRARTEARRGFLGLLEYRGREDAFRIGVRHALIRSRARSLYLSAELAGIDTRSSLFGIEVVRENVRTLAAGLTYDWADSDGSLSLMAVNIVQGLDGLGASAAANPLRTRAQGRPDARYVTARFYRDQQLPSGFRLRLDNQVQMLASSRALLAASECTFGGPALGRAFDAGALSGDECWRGSAELARPMQAAGHAVEPYAFVDFGLARQHGPLEAGEARRTEAVAYGVGMRLFTRFGFSADLQASVPSRRLFPGGERDARLFFQLSYRR